MLEVTSAEPMAVPEGANWSQDAFEEKLLGHTVVWHLRELG